MPFIYPPSRIVAVKAHMLRTRRRRRRRQQTYRRLRRRRRRRLNVCTKYLLPRRARREVNATTSVRRCITRESLDIPPERILLRHFQSDSPRSFRRLSSMAARLATYEGIIASSSSNHQWTHTREPRAFELAVKSVNFLLKVHVGQSGTLYMMRHF